MAIDSVSQLTPEMQAAVPGAPGVPAPVLPVSNAIPDQQAAPDQQPAGVPAGPIAPIGAPPTPATSSSPTVNAIHDGINQAATATPVADRGKPGQWAKQILSGLSHAFSNVETSLGDVSAAQEEIARTHPSGGAGILDWIGAESNAKNARLQQQQKAQSEDDKTRADISLINIQKMYHQQLLHQMSDQANHQDIANGIAQIEAMTTHNVELGLAPADKLFTKLNEGQYQQYVQSGQIDPTKSVYFPDGSYQPLDPKTGKPMVDENNEPVLAKTFTVLEPPKQQVLTDAQVDRINKYVPTANIQHGTESHPVVIPGINALAYMEQANAAETYQAKRDLDLAKAGAEKLDADQKIASDNASNELAKNQLYLKAVAHFPNDLATLYRFMTGQYPEMVNGKPTGKMDPASLDAAKTNAGPLILMKYGGEKGYSAIVAKQQEDYEKERHDRADEAEKKVEDLKKQNESGSWSLQEDANGAPVLLNSKNGQTMPAPAGVQARGTKSKADAAFKKDSEPAIAALGYANSYLSNGVFTGSGDEALQEKFFELAKPTTGFRMSQPQMDMLQNSRTWMGSGEAKALHASTGVWFSPVQRQQIVATMQTLANSKLQALHGNAGQNPNIVIAPEGHQVKLQGGGTATKKNGKWVNDQTGQEVK